MANYRLKLARVNSLKLRVTTRIPALLIGTSFITVTRGDGGEYFVNPDYTVLSPGPITDATTAYIAVQDASAGIYKTVTLASLLTSSLDADLQVIGALTGTGILSRTASGAWALRTLTGTANEITVTNGDGVSGNPTLSLPSAITTTGKTITGGTYAGLTITGSTFNGNTWTAGTGTLTLGAGKTATISNTLTFTGTDASSVAFGAGGTVAYTANNLSAFAATTSAQLRSVLSDETGTGAAYFQGGDLGTPSAGVLTGATGLPVSTGISGLATGAATFLTTPSSANLRALLTDEVGTGAAYFIGGALGTPASATLTNGTGLPISTGITGAGTGVLTALAVNVGTAGSVVVNGGALGTPSSGTLTNATGLPLSGLTSQAAYTIVMNNSGSSAAPTAVDVTALTAKASPVSADIVLIQDSAASNAFKRTTVGALASAGSVASINGLTGALSVRVISRVFTASGTYTPTSGMIYAEVECVGGGAGAGSASGAVSALYGGGGGGSGGYSKSILTAATIGASKAIAIGAAGNGGASGTNNGVAGGDTTFGTTIVVAKGGAGGLYGAGVQVGQGGVGGIPGTGDITAAGSPGSLGAYNSAASQPALPPGMGGSSIWGGGAPSVGYSSGAATAGLSASSYGSGGSGAIASNIVASAAGGAGSAGVVFVTEYCVS